MTQQSNTDHLHDEGMLNKDEMSAEQKKAVDSLSQEEVGHLKSMHQNANKNSGQPVGIII